MPQAWTAFGRPRRPFGSLAAVVVGNLLLSWSLRERRQVWTGFGRPLRPFGSLAAVVAAIVGGAHGVAQRV